MGDRQMKFHELQVVRFGAEARDVVRLELVAPDGGELPAFTPGAHLAIRLPNGLLRHYSLVNDWRERQRYELGVGLAVDSRGGSRFIHGRLREGDRLQVQGPFNNFPLDGEAGRYCFLAGGIGITPIMAMIRWCVAMQRPWRLVYAVRSRQRAAFLEELLDLGAEHLQLYCSAEPGGVRLDVAELVAGLAADEQLYCCGPEPLLQALQQAWGARPAGQLHFERFAAPAEPAPAAAADSAFEVLLRRSGRRIAVAPGQSILEALEAAGIAHPFSCRAGICRTCETQVCAGEPEHRDFALSAAEHAAGRMLICVSRACGSSLELDL